MASPPTNAGAGGPRVSGGAGRSRADGPQNIATAITDVSERVAVLVHEEVELAKAEVAEKAAKLARGAVVAVAAGIFIVTALFFVLIGLAWLLYYEPADRQLLHVLLGLLRDGADPAGAWRARGDCGRQSRQKSSPPVPTMAIEEARLIRETMGASHDGREGR